MLRKSFIEQEIERAAPMAALSWSSSGGPRRLDRAGGLARAPADGPVRRRGPAAGCPKDVAEDRALTHPFVVPEAHAGMMVTPSVRLVRPLGEGGMGAVWVADHLALHTQVVVKFIASGLKDSKGAVERFSREAAAAAQVKSPHVVQTFDHGLTSDGTPYIVMELLEGRDLGAFLEGHGRAPPELVVEMVAQLARALDRAHERKIVHRDIKPGNIFLCDGGNDEVFVKLLDFGIAKGVDVPILDSGTKTGTVVGSPFYMSPEQILGSKSVDYRSDLWSVGVVVYEALTGEKPFDAETMGGLAIRIHTEALPTPSAALPSLPPSVDAWFSRACARSASDRFGTAREMAEALARAVGGEMPPSVSMPRVSTGANSNDGGGPRPVALGTGATTEAGVAGPVVRPSTRNRVMALVVAAPVMVLATFFVVNAVIKRDRPPPPVAVSADPPPSAPASATIATTAPSPPPVATATSSAPVASIETSVSRPPAVKLAAPRTVRAAPSSSSPRPPNAPPTAALPTPAPTGHDIF